MSQSFEWPVRVYYEDTDAGRVVYHSQYLNFMERARTEWLRAKGFEQDELAQREGIVFVVHRIEVDFRRPARFNDALLVTVEPVEQRLASLTLAQTIRREADGELLIRGRVRVACVSAESFRPLCIPEHIAREMA